jgi:xylan 1,4-beta-xylosidase
MGMLLKLAYGIHRIALISILTGTAIFCVVSHSCPMLAQGTVSPPTGPSTETPVAIRVDLGKAIGPYTPIYRWFGYDEANYTTMPNGVKLLRELHDLSPQPVYIRAHHLLTTGDGVAELKWSSTNVYKEDANGKPVYNFTILDGIFDTYKAAGVRPMVELGFMPKDLATGKEPYQVHYPGRTTAGSVQSPPKDYDKWRELVRALVAHLVERYGKETVLQWYFEVWNEPNIDYWHGTPEEYWKLYDYSVAGVRAALPGARVGGPASTGPGNANAYRFLHDFLEHVSTGKSAANGEGVPIDFISFHVKGQPRISQDQGESRVRMGLDKELTDADRGFEIIAKYPQFRAMPIILSEADPEGCAACSSKVNPANNYRNGTLYPAYTAAAYKGLFELQDRRGVNLLAMLSWSFEFEDKDYFEGFRSLATNGIDKPILNFFRMAALMHGNRVSTSSSGQVSLDDILANGVRANADIDAMATRGDSDAAVLLWNYHDIDEQAPAAPTAVTIAGIPANVRRVLLTHYRIDDMHSNAYTVWKAMGSPQHPTIEQYAELKRKDGLQLLTSPEWVDVVNKKITIDTEMPRQSISLLQVSWRQ